MPSPACDYPLLDFSKPCPCPTFRVINDGVMGGSSVSRVELTEAGLRFEGHVSLANNGGFASFRGPIDIPARASALRVTVRGDGKRYKLTLKRDDSPMTPQYQAVFIAASAWRTLRFVPSDFVPSFRGRAVDAPALRFGDARHFGLLIGEKQAGPFRIELESVRWEQSHATEGDPS